MCVYAAHSKLKLESQNINKIVFDQIQDSLK